MFRFEADLRVFLHREPVDFRAGINSLVTLVEQSMQLDTFARAVSAFHNRRRNRIKYFKALYQVETLAKADLREGETRVDYTYQLRQQHSVPLLEAFGAWLDEQAPQVLPESLLGKAISYARNQWTYLCRYVSDGRAAIENNVIERDIRPFCTGRSSRLFSDTVAGAKASAMVYSLMLTTGDPA
ncbi:hypothetical protein HDG35_003554 [Paraburkholderia sp. JPY681]|nr:hypothetical protein [Paraburkholderia atlantica]